MTELKQPVNQNNPIVFFDIQIGHENGKRPLNCWLRKVLKKKKVQWLM